KLRNLSSDTIFAPLDEAFLRERAPEIRDSLIRTGPNQSIEMYPLAVESEWAIVDQEIRALKPGETLETLIVSAPDALSRTAPEMTWLIRLRTGINRTDVLAVRFFQGEIQADP